MIQEPIKPIINRPKSSEPKTKAPLIKNKNLIKTSGGPTPNKSQNKRLTAPKGVETKENKGNER
jgi:hypothetical protein